MTENPTRNETDRYTIVQLAHTKGTSQPVAEAMLLMQRKIMALEAERDAAIEVCKTAAAWLGSWGQHYGSCRGGNVCTCGLTRNQYELAAAQEPKP